MGICWLSLRPGRVYLISFKIFELIKIILLKKQLSSEKALYLLAILLKFCSIFSDAFDQLI